MENAEFFFRKWKVEIKNLVKRAEKGMEDERSKRKDDEDGKSNLKGIFIKAETMDTKRIYLETANEFCIGLPRVLAQWIKMIRS